MAIIPESQYAGKIAPATTEYPYGGARNITTPGDGTGTPWEAALVNDIFGFQQALLSESGIVPSGTPERANDSQYLRALKSFFGLALSDVSAISELDASKLTAGQRFYMVGWRPSSNFGGGPLIYDPNRPQTDHDGGAVYALGATPPSDFNDPAEIEAYLNAGGGLSGNGCLVRPGVYSVTPSMFGAKVGVNSSSSLKAALESSYDVELDRQYVGNPDATITSDKTIFGSGGITLESDFSNFITINADVKWRGPSVDFGGNEALSGWGFRLSGGALTVSDADIGNLNGETFDYQYLIFCRDAVTATINIENCELHDVYNLGDGVTTNRGFAGAVFVWADTATLDKIDLNIKGSTLRDFETIFPDGSGFTDTDADAVRTFVTGAVLSDRDKITVRSSGNKYIRCQKRAYKLNNATAYIDDDDVQFEGDFAENALYPDAVLQQRDSKVFVNGLRFRGPLFLSGFYILGTTDYLSVSNVDEWEITNPEIARDPGQRHELVNIQGASIEGVDLSNIKIKNVETIIRAENASLVLRKVNLRNIKSEDGTRICRLDGDIDDVELNDVTITTNITAGTNETRTLQIINSNATARNIVVKSTEISDNITRVVESGNPHSVDISGNVQIDGLVHKTPGAPPASVSMNLQNADGCIFRGVRSPVNINFSGSTDCTLAYSVYASRSANGGITDQYSYQDTVFER